MKKLFLIFAASLVMASCTENSMVKNFGGTGTLDLPANTKLVNVTWKNSELWILTTPMDSGYVPKTYEFAEKSSFGLVEGLYKINETK